jgi:hypothetical protein
MLPLESSVVFDTLSVPQAAGIAKPQAAVIPPGVFTMGQAPIVFF